MNTGILKYIDGPLDGDSWEELCNSCYRMHYESEHFTEIPAVHKGDAGIEGFTQTGIVNQCYCPEREYSDDDLYTHMRKKMTDDIKKLTLDDYKARFAKMGIPPIREWHFVVPYYRDSRIIEHAQTKRKEIMALKSKSPNKFEHIDKNFVILIKTAENFRVEITRLIRTTLTDVKLNFAIRHTATPDWEKCDSDKVNNIIRKTKAVMGNGNVNNIDKEQLDEVVNLYVDCYIKGMDIMNTLRVSYSEVYEDIYALEQQYKKQVEIKTKMNIDKSINSKLFNEILDDFESKLTTEFSYLNMASIMELKLDLISGWLADCSMQFKE